jgi:tetratricopeptide (TPR) repeat protein
MADGIKPRAKRVRAERAPTTPDPIEIAMELDAADAAPDSPAREVLRKHSRLIDSQLKYLGLQTFSERLSAGLKMLVAAVGLVASVSVGLMVWDASQDRSLVIKALNVPPELESRGLTGEVLAAKLLDRLAEIDATARSFRAAETFRNDWGSDIQVEIPQTGVSIGELDRTLRQWLGNRTEIGGEVVIRDQALALTVRVGAEGTVTATGQEAEVDALLQRLAEGVFERSQPFRYSKYLELSGRPDEAMAVAVRLAETGPQAERPWAWAQISNLNLNAGDIAAAAEAGRRAVALDPEQALGWLNLGVAENILGHVREGRNAMGLAIELLKAERGQLSREGIAFGYRNEAQRIARLGDIPEAARIFNRAEARVFYDGVRPPREDMPGAFLIRLHEVKRGLAVPALDSGDDAGSVGPDDMRDFRNQGIPSFPQAQAAAMLEDWPAERRMVDARLASARAEGPRVAVFALRHIEPRLAILEARTGDLAAARARVAALPEDCDPCLQARAQVAALSGERVEAERLFARLARRNPDVPDPLVTWARTRLDRGDPAGALPLLRQAAEFGPRWAEPQKYQGDALLALGRHAEAVTAYRAAIERAPRWGGAHLGLGRALAAMGRDRDAAKSYAAAAGMDLTATERALLARLRPPVTAAGR